MILSGKETKIFDPADGFGAITDPVEITDATIALRGDRWWMYLAGQTREDSRTELYSASLPPQAPLTATGWTFSPDPDHPEIAARLADHEQSGEWDRNGGRHCPSYVVGWDPHTGRWAERIYYAGSAENLWGPYTIGYLEWDGSRWIDQPEPAFIANQNWEHGSVYEPNLIYADGKWKMWYVAGSNAEDYLVQGYAESVDGRTGWSERRTFSSPSEKLFDFCVRKADAGYEAVFSRVWVANTPAPLATGLWWCTADSPSRSLADWSEPIQIMTAEDRGWHSGPWKPTFHRDQAGSGRMTIFFDGIYNTGNPGPFPYAFTLGCLEIDIPIRRIRRTP